ncbi:MAG: enoyl-CoA hydratase [Rhizobiaceae bacterium]
MAEIVEMRRAAQQGPVMATLDDGVLWLTLANPPANALSIATMTALQSVIDRAAGDGAVRVVVISAAPGKVFSGGHDLKEMTSHRTDPDNGRAFFEQTFNTCSQLMLSITNLPKPVIAAVDGIATAAGCQLVATCDLAVATDRATFGVNGIDVGLFCSTPMVALSRRIGQRPAMEMLMTGEMIDAQTARSLGLVNRVVPPEYLEQAAGKMARTLAAKSPTALKLGKAAFYAQADLGLAEAYAHTSRVIVDNMLAGDAREGIGAFIDKRKPEFRGD